MRRTASNVPEHNRTARPGWRCYRLHSSSDSRADGRDLLLESVRFERWRRLSGTAGALAQW